jgi:hypothetical protein
MVSTTLGPPVGPRSSCNCPTLSYKMTRQTPNSNKLNSSLNRLIHIEQYISSGRRVLCFGGLNHLKICMSTLLDPSNWAYERLNPFNNKSQRAPLVAVPVEVSSRFDIWCAGRVFYRSRCSGFTKMVNIQSMAASTHPSRHGQEAEGETNSCSRAGWSRRASCHVITVDAAAVVAPTQCQRSVATAATPPLEASPEGTLAAACVLLHNPPGLDASSEAAEQWHNDIDQLIVTVINTPSYKRLSPHHSDGTPATSPALLCTPFLMI